MNAINFLRKQALYFLLVIGIVMSVLPPLLACLSPDSEFCIASSIRLSNRETTQAGSMSASASTGLVLVFIVSLKAVLSILRLWTTVRRKMQPLSRKTSERQSFVGSAWSKTSRISLT